MVEIDWWINKRRGPGRMDVESSARLTASGKRDSKIVKYKNSEMAAHEAIGWACSSHCSDVYNVEAPDDTENRTRIPRRLVRIEARPGEKDYDAEFEFVPMKGGPSGRIIKKFCGEFIGQHEKYIIDLVKQAPPLHILKKRICKQHAKVCPVPLDFQRPERTSLEDDPNEPAEEQHEEEEEASIEPIFDELSSSGPASKKKEAIDDIDDDLGSSGPSERDRNEDRKSEL